MRLLLATTNANKVREIRAALTSDAIELLTLADLPRLPEPDESAATFWENARLKALGYHRAVRDVGRDPGLVIAAEDSGLEIAGLGGAPGVHSARFLGAGVPYAERFAEIYRRLEGLPPTARDARFVTALAVVRSGEVIFETEAAIDGTIHAAPSGQHGFGYDPIFFYPPLNKTTAELTMEEKCIVSHRARAFRDFARWLRHAQLT
jgi:XTP/dITP diphosphohydrolase